MIRQAQEVLSGDVVFCGGQRHEVLCRVNFLVAGVVAGVELSLSGAGWQQFSPRDLVEVDDEWPDVQPLNDRDLKWLLP